MAEQAGRPIRRIERDNATVTEEDLKIALELEAEGKPIPESLQSALDAHHKSNGSKGTGSKSDEEEEEEDDDASEDTDTEDEEEESEKSGSKAKDKSTPAQGGEEEEDEDEEDEDDESEDEDEDEDENDVESGSPQRPVRYVPISRHQKAKAGWKAREKELAEALALKDQELEKLRTASTETTKAEQEKKLADLSDKTGFSADDLKALIDHIASSLPLPEHLKNLTKEDIDRLRSGSAPLKDDKEKKFWDDQYTKFNELFDRELKEPGADPKMKEHKERIRKLYFSKGNEHKSIYEIWNRILKPKVARKATAPESPGGYKGGGGELDWEAIANDPEKIRNLTPEQAEKFTEHMGNKPRPIRRSKFSKPQT